jgi:hypothetical protein
MAKSVTVRPVNGAIENTLQGQLESIAPIPAVDPNAGLMAELARLKAENDRLKTATATRLTLKVSDKGALSVYGMGRFPVTLYREQWEKLFAMAEQIKAFISANSHILKTKGDN